MSERKFPFAMPRKWKNKESGGIVKVLPWFQPIEERSQFDFAGLMKDLIPEFEGDFMADFEVYKGLVMMCGWQLENKHGIWFCLAKSAETQFEDLGEWHDPVDPDPASEVPVAGPGTAANPDSTK